jgi:hypothetical protein
LTRKRPAVSSTISTFLGFLDMPDELREIEGLGQYLDEPRWIS